MYYTPKLLETQRYVIFLMCGGIFCSVGYFNGARIKVEKRVERYESKLRAQLYRSKKRAELYKKFLGIESTSLWLICDPGYVAHLCFLNDRQAIDEFHKNFMSLFGLQEIRLRTTWCVVKEITSNAKKSCRNGKEGE
ncbi:hypothetical protein Hdeb2414_s0213g00835431 [Helianthus debilis subsp. tardiflorus]